MKRDAVVAFLRHCEAQKQFADEEIERIQKRKAFISRVKEELENRLIQIFEQFAVPDRKGVKRLEGNCPSLRIQKNPDSVLVIDANLVPAAFKSAVLTMPAYVWESLLQCLSTEHRKEFEALGAELKDGTDVPGADLAFGQWRLAIA